MIEETFSASAAAYSDINNITYIIGNEIHFYFTIENSGLFQVIDSELHLPVCSESNAEECGQFTIPQ
jgi:hypothetical protein